ncbi:hypothetical protein D9757_007251 [Collybiopsis confluens]|uniref:Uncharacterized protein n=1 Tax=Collybiopsis confluens TaxID=2823264 RepID=A0A8H5HGN6_9AGAR|nr:hypothetical protein D9757_007251 [Collybiopsis confluens]
MTGIEQQERQESYSLISYPNLDSTAPMAPDHDHLDGEHYLVPSYEGLPPDTVTGYVGLPMAYSENNHHANYYQPGCEITVAPPSPMYATSSGPEYHHDDFLHSYLETSFPSQWNYDQCFFSGDEHYN